MITVNGMVVNPTIFPDKTSQVWKLPDSMLLSDINHVRWEFEEESELIHFLQYVSLVRVVQPECQIHLYCPYLPYARQDKDIDNNYTFALHTFLGMIAMVVDNFSVFDPHSTELLKEYFEEGKNLTIVEPDQEIKIAIEESGCDLVCYPDKGASKRYPFLGDGVVMDKVRDQSTGKILGMEIVDNPQALPVVGKTVLIVDDLCDGGRTFVGAAECLYKQGAKNVCLYVSHGIFSHKDGVDFLHDNGISEIYTKDGLRSVDPPF